MIVVPLHEHFSPVRLALVIERMRTLGAPRIHAYFDATTRAWFSREGTHRLRAAKMLGIAPIMVPTRWPRNRSALERARYAIARRGHVFDTLQIDASETHTLFPTKEL
jgi:hypothetical protein